MAIFHPLKAGLKLSRAHEEANTSDHPMAAKSQAANTV
jgi:hypothetical protein